MSAFRNGKADLPALAERFHVLGDPVRLRIMKSLAGGAKRVIDLSRELGIPQPAVSRQLASLRAAGLIQQHHNGAETFSSLVADATPGRHEVMRVSSGSSRIRVTARGK